MKKHSIMAVSLLLYAFVAQAQIVSTVAGDGTAGYVADGIPATSAELNVASGVALDASGNLYIADFYNSRVRKMNTSGIISTFAGTGVGLSTGDGGPATAAEIGEPSSVATDGTGNVYFADAFNHCVRKVNTSGIISTIAGTGTAGYNGDGITATTAQLNNPSGMVIDASGNVYILDGGNKRVRKVNTSGIISTFAGSGSSGAGDGGPATDAQLFVPGGLAIDAAGNVYISDAGATSGIRKVNTIGIISTIAGNGTAGFSGDGGPATAAEIQPQGLTFDGAGNLYFTDNGTRVRKVSTSGTISTVGGNGTFGYIGDGMVATATEFNGVADITADASGNLYVTDVLNNRVRKITGSTTIPSAVNTISSNACALSVYPNPNVGCFSVTGSLHSICDEMISLQVTNILGQVVYSKNIAAKDGDINLTMHLPDVADGLYWLHLLSEKEKMNVQFLIEK